MIDLKDIDNIYIAPGYTDMRKSIDSCSAIVQYKMYLDPFSKSIFLFCNKKKNTLQILEWDGNGFWLHKKKLVGKDKFRWPKCDEDVTSLLIDKRQLEWLLDGLEIHQKHAHHEVHPVII